MDAAHPAARDATLETDSMHDKRTQWWWLMAAWAVALTSTLGALFISEVMGMTPCVLCWYQRIVMFPLALIQGMAVFTEDRRGAVDEMPFALAGLALAAYHSALIADWVPQWWVPCGTGPSCSQQALVSFGPEQLARLVAEEVGKVQP
ncbi:MAG: disulfide bond formation protein B [Betaproteobacteria bacterium]|nr:MAG: disulfide bond formation protein B [Betaproteobacteria bacterium]